MMNVIKVLIPIAVIALVCLFTNLINAKKDKRIQQFPLIFVSIILMTAVVIILVNFYNSIENIIAQISFLLGACLLIANLLLLVVFFILKLILRPLCTAIFKKKQILEIFALSFYEYDEEYDKWFLKKRWNNFRQFFFWLICGTAFVSGLYLGLTWALDSESKIWFLIFPCAAVVVVNEIYGYINGQTKEEFEHSVFGEDSDSRRVSNYYKLREILEQILPSPLLSAHTGCEFMCQGSALDLIKKLGDSEDFNDKITSEYFKLNDRYQNADVDYVQATADMMRRKNVVFFNPFYRDLSMYITFPMVRSLLAGKKCVVLCGRKNSAADVKEWLLETLHEYSHMKSLWRVDFLSDKEPECEVGILTFTQIYDKHVVNTNREFFHNTDFVLLIEPSLMLNTSQVALSIIAEEMNINDELPVYCICDRYTDGLIDTMSHLIRSEITDVVAMPVPRCNYTVMSWDADGDFCRQQLFDKQTRYLGGGIELAAIAVKNQVPTVTWYSERKSPIRDIKWIAGQNYSTICRYMNQPCQQKDLYEKIKFVPTLWSSEKTKEQFVVAEDEFCNMFSIMRAYLSRGSNQIFVNVLSENYLLRDYMRCNRQMFMSNPNAVPSYVPDYAKTERNTILKLIIMMTLRPVSEDEIINELHLIGIETDDAYSLMLSLLKKYTYADCTIFTSGSVRTNVDEFTTKSTCFYSVSEEEFEKYFSKSLKNAYYILEDEKNEEGYIDAKLFSHVTQTVLPGQFVTYDGKYYKVKFVSPQSGVVLRRASDQFDGRKYYRQMRKYVLDFASCSEIVSDRKVMDVEFAEIRTNFSVTTDGYLEMSDSHNLRTARTVDLSKDPSVDNFTRSYHNKSVLRVKLPESDDKICFTICLLLSEVFRSVFPDGWQYLAVITKRPENIDGILNYVVYSSEGDVEPGYIYIVEDSDLDLGLLNAVEKNFMRFMEIIADFLDWHFEKMREPASKDPVPVKILAAEEEEKKHRNLVVKMLDRIKQLFGGKKEENVEIADVGSVEKTAEQEPTEKEPVTPDSEVVDNETENEPGSDDNTSDPEEEFVLDDDREKDESSPIFTDDDELNVGDETDIEEETDDPELQHTDGTDIFEDDAQAPIDYRVEEQLRAFAPVEKTRYQRDCFLKFGYEEIDERIHADELRKYLRVRGWCNNSLTLARKRDAMVLTQSDLKTDNHCDFCSLPLTGVSYERLNDGRIRCNNCSSSAITTLADFKDLFYRCLSLMSDFYDIRFNVPISVKTVDAREVAKGVGMVFKPSTEMAARVLGYAQRRNDKFSIIIENGSPRLAAIDTIVHEMTHIWQYLNWNDADILGIYGMKKYDCTMRARDIIYEGMAMWSAIQYLYQIGETYYAAQQEALAESRKDVYGVGFRLYREQYPLVKDSSLLKITPFKTFPTLEPADVIKASCSMCTEDKCVCQHASRR